MQEVIDPLDDTIGRGGVRRDGSGRALLVPPGGGERVPYTSMSTLAGQLNAFAKPLHQWEMRMAVIGTAMSREDTAIAGSSRYSTRIGEEDAGRNREEAAIIDEVIERGKERAGGNQKAQWGTGFHRYAEQDDPLGEPPEDMAGDIEAFRRTLELLGIKILATEVFVVNELLGAAGTFDYALLVPWRPNVVVIGDSKTGKLKPDQCEIQLAGYAVGSEIYDLDTDERISFENAFGMPADQELGYIPHTPPMSGQTELWPIDLVAGRGAASLASQVHRWNAYARKRYNKKVWKPVDVEAVGLERALGKMEALELASPSFEDARQQLRDLHREFKAVWTDELTQRGGRLLRTLKEAA